MVNVWIFGDSFAHYSPYNLWFNQIVTKLNLIPRYYGLGGTSLGYTFDRFRQVRNEIQTHDVIIMALSDINRKWFYKDYPSKTLWEILNSDTCHSKAVEQYLKYLENNTVNTTYFTNFLYNLHNVTEKLNTHTILLPGFNTTLNELNFQRSSFPSFQISDCSLVDISSDEFKDKDFLNKYMLNLEGGDLRRCHFIEANHNVLADKIIDNILNKKPLLFKQGFVKSILDKNALTDINFCRNELFDVHLVLGSSWSSYLNAL